MMENTFIKADLPIDGVNVFTTTTLGGVSQGDFYSFNLGDYVGDAKESVTANRQKLQAYLGDTKKIMWLKQVHGEKYVVSDKYNYQEADASIAFSGEYACAILTADCLPVVLIDQSNYRLAGLHCGWRGLYNNLLPSVINRFFDKKNTIAWLGPAISQAAYEVDHSFYKRFLSISEAFQVAFYPSSKEDHYQCDLYQIARIRLQQVGLLSDSIYGGGFCTFADDRFYSYRQSNKTGRQVTIATLV